MPTVEAGVAAFDIWWHLSEAERGVSNNGTENRNTNPLRIRAGMRVEQLRSSNYDERPRGLASLPPSSAASNSPKRSGCSMIPPRDTTYDLGQLADELGNLYPQLEELYPFGSRRFRTKSHRSDIDILVIKNTHIAPRELRKFAEEHCRALDFFLVQDGKATSCQNESYIEAESTPALIRKLDAVKFWARSAGRIQADIDWTFKLRPDVQYAVSALPNRRFGTVNLPGELTIGDLLRSLTPVQFWGFVGAIITLIASAFAGGYWFGTHQPTKGP
jgi:hypothetical protein